MTCWFCDKEEEQQGKGYEVEMYGDVTQSQGNTEEAVSFNKKLVVVPRCAPCKTHQRKGKVATTLTLVFLVLALAAGSLGFFGVIKQGYIWGIALGFSLGMVIEFLTIRAYALKGVKSERQARHLHEEVQGFIDRGYAFGRAPKQQKVNEALIEE